MNNQINIYVILVILFMHWFADFVLQTDKQARGKSKNWNDLLSHTFEYSVIWLFLGSIYCYPYVDNILCLKFMVVFPIITFICHTITDYFTSRLNSKLWEEKKVHLFFVSVGFDQFLHFVQLLITFQLLSNN